MLSDNMMLGGSGRKAAYSMTNSLLFRGTQYLSRTPSVAGDGKTFTLSMWVRRTSFAQADGDFLFMAGSNTNDALYVLFGPSDTLNVSSTIGNAWHANLVTS